MKLFDACEINPRQQGISDDTLVSFVAMPDVSEDGKIKTNVIRPFSEVKKGYTVFQEGDILFAKITPCMENGKGALATGLKNGIGVGSTEFHVLRPNPGYVDGMWVYYLTAWPAFRHEAESHMTGSAGQRRVPKSFLEEYSLSVPSLKTQHEQVEHLNRINKVIEARKEQLCIFDDLIKARFVEMFGDFKTNPKGWPIVGFEEIATIDGNMTTDYERFADYPHIGIDSIEKDTGILRGYRTVAEDGVISGKYVFTPEHIIYSKIRPNLNKVALPDFVGLCSADAYPILPIPGKCNRVFLAYNMRSTFFLDYILQFCNRTNLPKVNRKEVSGFRTPLPPLALQNEFATFVSQVDKSKVVDL